MGMKKMDIFEKWRESGQLPQILDFIRDCSRKLVSQREISQYLNINEATFSRLKKAHPEIEEVQMKAKFDLKKDLVGTLYKKAMGFETIEEEQFIEDKGKGQESKRKIHRIKKQVPPDYKSILYLLTKNFGREYCERFEEMQLVEKKMAEAKEVWESEQQNENSDD